MWVQKPILTRYDWKTRFRWPFFFRKVNVFFFAASLSTTAPILLRVYYQLLVSLNKAFLHPYFATGYVSGGSLTSHKNSEVAPIILPHFLNKKKHPPSQLVTGALLSTFQ